MNGRKVDWNTRNAMVQIKEIWIVGGRAGTFRQYRCNSTSSSNFPRLMTKFFPNFRGIAFLTVRREIHEEHSNKSERESIRLKREQQRTHRMALLVRLTPKSRSAAARYVRTWTIASWGRSRRFGRTHSSAHVVGLEGGVIVFQGVALRSLQRLDSSLVAADKSINYPVKRFGIRNFSLLSKAWRRQRHDLLQQRGATHR